MEYDIVSISGTDLRIFLIGIGTFKMSATSLIILTIVGWGIGSFLYKTANESIHPIMVSTIITIVHVIATPFALYFIKFDKSLNSTGIIYSLAGGILMSVGSLGYMFALKKGGAGEITAVTSLYPAVTLFLSMMFLNEDLTWRKGIGILLALSSVLVLGWK